MLIVAKTGGKILEEGLPREIVKNERVIKAYLGEKYAKGL